MQRQDRIFSFRFAALNFSQPEKNEYAYRLINFDKEWNQVGKQNYAFFTNIPPGKYTFQVIAANNDHYWNEEGVRVDLVIQPAYWQTLWFRLLVLSVFMLAVYGIYKIRVKALIKNKEVLERAVAQRTTRIREQNQQLESTLQELKSAQGQLVQSEKMASLGQLTAGIAHEINNPINFVASNVQALKMDFTDIRILLEAIARLPDCGDAVQCLEQLKKLSQEKEASMLGQEIDELIAGIERGARRTQDIVSSLRTFSRDTNESFGPADIHDGLNSTLTILSNKLKNGISYRKGLW